MQSPNKDKLYKPINQGFLQFEQKITKRQPRYITNQRSLTEAQTSQNLIGWNKFLRGFVSKHWKFPNTGTRHKKSPTYTTPDILPNLYGQIT